MSEEPKLDKLEHLKEDSRQLRGPIAEELNSDVEHFSADAKQLLKFHGSYQQDDRDLRNAKLPDGTRAGKTWICMVRTRIPGGKVTPEQFLAELDLCEKYGNGTLRITTRQGYQLHGVLKENIKETIRGINASKLTTLAACGDVERNVICCPAPYKHNKVRQQMQDMADAVAAHLKPRTTAYYEIWLQDEEGESQKVDEFKPVDEPIYGARYLPRKFKTAFALPDDNCIDVYSNDLGYIGIVENDELVGYNVVVGGSMGTTPSAAKTFPAIAKRMTFVRPEQVLDLTEAVVKVQRDFGNREDRKVARMKYLIADWGIEKFKAKVEEYYGQPLPDPLPIDVTDADDHIGWHEQGDGNYFVGINIDNGRIKDEGDLRIKTGLRTIVEKYRTPVRNTALQSIILCDISPKEKPEIERILDEHGILPAEDLSLIRRYAMACPAVPTCGLAVTESERVMPELLASIEAEAARHGLADERFAIHMTGCPNGCARPYTPDIGLVGKTRGKYTLFLGGNVEGTRMAFLYKDLVLFEEIASTLSPLFGLFVSERNHGESFGDFCHRVGKDALLACTEQATVDVQ